MRANPHSTQKDGMLEIAVQNESEGFGQHRTGSRLIAIFYKQYERRTLLLLARAFRQWNKVFPLQNKCDELCHQLRERTSILETVRNSYLKDVVGIKHHLNQLSGLDPHFDIEKYKEALFDLNHNLPSVDIRGIIEKAKKGWTTESSQMFRDTLVDSGIIDPESGKTLNSWEQSRSFRRMQRVRRGPSYNFPPAGGESISLAAPANFKLFVRNCSECTGLIALVKNWNSEVEASLKFKVENDRIHERIDEFKKLIRSLQDIIESKEHEVLSLLRRKSELEEANQWFQHWIDSQQTDALKNRVEEQRRLLKEQADMAAADKESALLNFHFQRLYEIERLLEREKDFQKQLIKEKAEREKESKLRVQLSDELRDSQRLNHRFATDIERLNEQNEQLLVDKKDLQQRFKALDKEHLALKAAMDLKEAQFEEYRHTTSNRLQDLHQEIQELHKDLHKKEDENDRLRDDIRTKKLLISKQAAEIAKFRETVEGLEGKLSGLEAQIQELEETLTQHIAPKPRKLTLRIVAIAIRSLFRLGLGIKRCDLRSLGLFGHQILLNNQETKNRRLHGDLQNMQQRFLEMQDKILKYEMERETLHRSIADLKHAEALREKELQELREIVEKQEQEIQSLESQRVFEALPMEDKSEWLLQNAVSQIVNRVKVFVSMQRSIAADLGRLLLRTRGRVQSWNLEWNVNEIAKEMRLMDKLFDSTSNEAVSPSRIASHQNTAKQVVAASDEFKKLRAQSLWKMLRGFVQSDLVMWLRGQRATHTFPVSLGYDGWQRWVSLSNIDPWTGKLKEIEGNDELDLRSTVSHFHSEEKRKVGYIGAFLNRDISNIEEYITVVQECLANWREKLSRFADLDCSYRNLVEKYADLLNQFQQLQKSLAADRTVISRMSEKTSVSTRMKLMQMRNNFKDLMEQDMSAYLANVLGAISDAQAEHNSLNTSRSSAGGASGSQTPTKPASRRSTSVKLSLRGSVSNSNTNTSTSVTALSARGSQTLDVEKDPNFQAAVQTFSRPGSAKSAKMRSSVMRRVSASQFVQCAPLNDISERSIEEAHSLEGLSLEGVEDEPIVNTQYTASNAQSDQVLPIDTRFPSFLTMDPDSDLSQSHKFSQRPMSARTVAKKVTVDEETSPSLSRLRSRSQSKSFVYISEEEGRLDDDDMLELEFEEERDDHDDLVFHGELDIMRKEMETFIEHERGLKTQISTLTQQVTTLQDANTQLEQEVEELRAEFANHYQDRFTMRRELTKLLNEFEKVCHENSLLREMVQDGYRHFSGEKADILASVDSVLREHERRRREAQQRMKSKETQVDCVACEMLYYGKLMSEPNKSSRKKTPSSSSRATSPSPPQAHLHHHSHRFPSAAAYHEHLSQDREIDSDLAAEPHGPHAQAYGEAVILIPRHRRAPDLPLAVNLPPENVDPGLEDMALRMQSFRDEYDDYVAQERFRTQPRPGDDNPVLSGSFVEHVLKSLSLLEDPALLLTIDQEAKLANQSQKSEKVPQNTSSKKKNTAHKVIAIPMSGSGSSKQPQSHTTSSRRAVDAKLQVIKLEEPSLALSTQRRGSSSVAVRTERSLITTRDDDLANIVYKDKDLFSYAKPFIRPQTASSTINNSSTALTNRPKSGLAHSQSARMLPAGTAHSPVPSKFRQIKQIPKSAPLSEKDSISSSSPYATTQTQSDFSGKPRPISSSALIRNMYSGKKTSGFLSPAELTASTRRDERTISNTAAFLQENVLSKKMSSGKRKADIAPRHFDDETLDDCIVVDDDDTDAKEFDR